MNITLRKGTKEDLKAALDLIIELAIYEKAENEVVNTIEKMQEDGFGADPIFHFILAEVDGKVAGMALCYFRYSTWKGKRLFLEDLIVKEEMRGFGIGEKLLHAVIANAKERNCTGVMWQVLDWNVPAINFYNKFGVRYDKGWYNVHLDL